MNSLDPIKLLRVSVGESAAWAKLAQRYLHTFLALSISCFRGNKLDDTG